MFPSYCSHFSMTAIHSPIDFPSAMAKLSSLRVRLCCLRMDTTFKTAHRTWELLFACVNCKAHSHEMPDGDIRSFANFPHIRLAGWSMVVSNHWNLYNCRAGGKLRISWSQEQMHLQSRTVCRLKVDTQTRSAWGTAKGSSRVTETCLAEESNQCQPAHPSPFGAISL